MEKNNKKNGYYKNNKKYYSKKKKKEEIKEEKITYEQLVNTINDSDDAIVDFPVPINDDDESTMKFVFVSIVIMAIIFGSLLLFHLI